MKLSSALLAGAASLALLGAAAPAFAWQDQASETTDAQAEARAAFDARIDEITAQFFRDAPEFATALSLPEEIAGEDYNARLGEYGPEADERERQRARDLLAELEGVDPAPLDEQRALTLRLFIDRMGAAVAAADAAEYGAAGAGGYTLYPVTQLSGIHVDLPNLMQAQQPVTDAEQAGHYIARLNEFGRAFDQTIDLIERDRDLGVVPPDFVLEKTLAVIANFTEPAPEENILATSFEEKLAGAEIEDADAHLAQAVEAIEMVVYPAYERLQATLEGLQDEAVHDATISRLPGGDALYQALILLNADDAERTGEQIHQIGLDEVARIHEEMEARFAQLDMTEGTIGERVEQLSTDERYVYPNTDEGRDELLDDLNDQLAEIEPLLPEWFGTIPPQPVEVRRVPEFSQESAPGGYYNLPAMDGSRPGIYWINLRDTAIWPRWSLKTLTYHEANPGHHFQLALNMANEDTPLLRKLTASTNAFAEGWGLYSELLAEEMGLYEGDPEGDIGRLQSELFRAARLVVDSGMHALGWSREDAIEYFVDSGAVTNRSDAVVEIERYAAWPAQALGYKMGMIQIVEMRERAEQALGEDFDIREFHDLLLLDGGLPLTLLNERVDEWIAAKRDD